MADPPAPFVTLAGPHRLDTVVGGSEFLAFADRADSPAAALAQLAALRARYPDATHHCWAYQIGAAQRFADDGEPGGTAGAPILRAIGGQGVDHVMVVVVRYYGGVKLGTGGLVRAYGGAAAGCLRAAPRTEVRPRQTLELSVPFEFLSSLYHLLAAFGAGRGEDTYTDTGVRLRAEVPPEEVGAFVAALQDATRGSARAEVQPWPDPE